MGSIVHTAQMKVLGAVATSLGLEEARTKAGMGEALFAARLDLYTGLGWVEMRAGWHVLTAAGYAAMLTADTRGDLTRWPSTRIPISERRSARRVGPIGQVQRSVARTLERYGLCTLEQINGRGRYYAQLTELGRIVADVIPSRKSWRAEASA